MLAPEIEARLGAIFRDALDLPPGSPVADVTRENFPEWDSLRHVKIILEVQKAFGMRFAAAEIIRLSSFAEIRAELEKKV